MYTVRSKDRSQAIYHKTDTNDYVALYNAPLDGITVLFMTDSKTEAREVFECTGGEYGEFEVVEE